MTQQSNVAIYSEFGQPIGEIPANVAACASKGSVVSADQQGIGVWFIVTDVRDDKIYVDFAYEEDGVE